MKIVKDTRYTMTHVADRMWERYNIFIGDPDYIAMCAQVRDKINVEFINEEKQKNDLQQIYDVLFKGVTVRVVWSVSKQYIKTVLPI